MPSPSRSSSNLRRNTTSYHYDRNYGAAFFQMITVALLCTSLAQPSWLSLSTHSMDRLGEICPRHLTLYQFFDFGYFETEVMGSGNTTHTVKIEYHSSAGKLGCLTPSVVNLLKVILMLNLMAIVLSFIGFLLDVMGTKSRVLYIIRANGFFTIATVLICTGIVGLAYYTTLLIEKENHSTHYVEVLYDYGFFTLTAAGVTALFATASSLFKRTNIHTRSRSRTRHLRSRSLDSSQLTLVENTQPPSTTDIQEPPPPYSP